MSNKEIKLAMPAKKSADSWVHDVKQKQDVKMKRFTVDVPLDLHTRVKTQCYMKGQMMADVLREILEREFPVDKSAA